MFDRKIPSISLPSPHALCFLPSGGETLNDHVAHVLRVARRGDAVRHAGHLLHEVRQLQIEVVFDEGEAGDVDAVVGTPFRFGECDACRFVGRRIDEPDVAAFDVGGWFAIGDDDDLPVLRRLFGEDAAGELQPGVDVREVFRDEAGRIVEIDSERDAGVEDADLFGGRV